MDRLEDGDPTQIGPFRLLGRLGEGGMGTVFLGESPGRREVAIKVVHRQFAMDPEYRRRFAEEVAAARKVGGFHTAQVVDADPDARLPWMATAYISGPSLADAIARDGPLGEAEVRKLGAALAEGLAAIHDHGIIHRDLKPANVILAADGPRIIDFGIAKSAKAPALTAPHTVIGTLHYMSPEQLSGQNLTDRSDTFALGAILTYAATGHDPFSAATVLELSAQILYDQPNLDPLTGELRDIIGACLAREPSDRPSPADLLVRFNPPEAAGESTAIGTTGPVTVALAHVRPAQVSGGGPRRVAVRESPAATAIDAGPPMPPQVSSPAVPPAAPPLGAGRPARKPRRRRRLAAMAAAGTVAVAGLAALSVLLLDKHPAAGLSATGSLAAKFTDTDPASQGGVFSVALGPGGILATGDNNGYTYLRNTRTGKITAFSDVSHQVVPSVAFGPGHILATDQVRSTDLWDITTGKRIARLSDPASGGVFSLAFGPGGTLAVGDHNGRAYLWNIATGKIAATFADPVSAGVDSVAFGPGGTVLAVGDHNGRAYLWNIATGKVAATFADPVSAGVDSVAFGPGGILAVGDRNGSAYLWNMTYHNS